MDKVVRIGEWRRGHQDQQVKKMMPITKWKKGMDSQMQKSIRIAKWRRGHSLSNGLTGAGHRMEERMPVKWKSGLGLPNAEEDTD